MNICVNCGSKASKVCGNCKNNGEKLGISAWKSTIISGSYHGMYKSNHTIPVCGSWSCDAKCAPEPAWRKR